MIVTDAERCMMAATLLAGLNANPDFAVEPDDRLTDLAIAQADRIVARVQADRDAQNRATLERLRAGGKVHAACPPSEWPVA